MTFWAPVSSSLHSQLDSADSLGLWTPQDQSSLAGLSSVSSWYPPHLCLPLPPQVAVLSVTEQTVPSVPATPEDSALLWGSPAAQGSPGDGSLQGKGYSRVHTSM